jgi:hypothetical protein
MKDHRLALAVWTLPVSTILLGLAHVPVSSLVLMAFAGRLIWRMAQDARERAAPAIALSAAA